MKDEKLSVIMGVWNPDRQMLEQAVQSILSQTFSDFCFYICDDGSTNGAYEWLRQYARGDGRIRPLRHEQNRGLACALNTCLAHCRGEYVARQDADDFSRPDRFEKQLCFLEEHPEIAVAGSALSLFDARGVWGGKQFPREPRKRDFLFAVPFMHGALMFRRQALLSCGNYRVCRHTRRTEDYDLLMRMYARGFCGYNLPDPLYAYREDQEAEQRRKYRYRVDEVFIRINGFYRLKLFPAGIPYAVKPLVVGLIPSRILRKLKMRHYHLRATQE